MKVYVGVLCHADEVKPCVVESVLIEVVDVLMLLRRLQIHEHPDQLVTYNAPLLSLEGELPTVAGVVR